MPSVQIPRQKWPLWNVPLTNGGHEHWSRISYTITATGIVGSLSQPSFYLTSLPCFHLLVSNEIHDNVRGATVSNGKHEVKESFLFLKQFSPTFMREGTKTNNWAETAGKADGHKPRPWADPKRWMPPACALGRGRAVFYGSIPLLRTSTLWKSHLDTRTGGTRSLFPLFLKLKFLIMLDLRILGWNSFFVVVSVLGWFFSLYL